MPPSIVRAVAMWRSSPTPEGRRRHVMGHVTVCHMELQRCRWHKTGNVLAALPKSAHPAAKKTLAEIYNAENKAAAVKAAHNFATEYGAKWPKAVAKIVDDLDVLTALYDYPAEHWIHLRTTDESFKAGVALSAGWDGVSLLGGRGRPRSQEQGRGAGSLAAQLAP